MDGRFSIYMNTRMELRHPTTAITAIQTTAITTTTIITSAIITITTTITTITP